jgi:hypothetical protein
MPTPLCRHRGARFVEELHELEETYPAPADEVLLGDAHVVEQQFGGVGGSDAEFARDLLRTEPVPIGPDHDL